MSKPKSTIGEILGGQFEAVLVKTDTQGRHFWEPRQDEVDKATKQIEELQDQRAKEELTVVLDLLMGGTSVSTLHAILTSRYQDIERKQQL